jgi:hypothetical protein
MGRKSANHEASTRGGMGRARAWRIKGCLWLVLSACSTSASDETPASRVAETVADRAGRLVPRAECNDTCASAGFACGELCGSSCGTCKANETCVQGWCKCARHCEPGRCDDGCGGACDCTVTNDAGRAANDAEPRVISSECGLRLRLLGRSGESVQLGIELAELSPKLMPRLIDVEVRASRALGLTRLAPGAALANTQVTLTRVGPERERADSLRLLLQDPEHSRPLAAGELATLTFESDDAAPISFWLARREQTFAPFEADAALRGCRFEQTLQVSP